MRPDLNKIMSEEIWKQGLNWCWVEIQVSGSCLSPALGLHSAVWYKARTEIDKQTCVFVCVCPSVGPLKTLVLTSDIYHLLPAGSPEMPLNLIGSHHNSAHPLVRLPACLPEINAKERKNQKGTRNKQQYNNRIFLGLISSASAELRGERTRLPLFIVDSLFSVVGRGRRTSRH